MHDVLASPAGSSGSIDRIAMEANGGGVGGSGSGALPLMEPIYSSVHKSSRPSYNPLSLTCSQHPSTISAIDNPLYVQSPSRHMSPNDLVTMMMMAADGSGGGGGAQYTNGMKPIAGPTIVDGGGDFGSSAASCGGAGPYLTRSGAGAAAAAAFQVSFKGMVGF